MIILRNFLVSEQLNNCYICQYPVICINHLYTGIVDSSGIRLFYTAHSPKDNAGVLTIGHNVIGHMIIPPHVERYTVTGFCSQKCTDKVSVLVTYLLKLNMHTYICIFLHKYNKNMLC